MDIYAADVSIIESVSAHIQEQAGVFVTRIDLFESLVQFMNRGL